jgi:Outer membrane protein beta-barrel domain
MRIKLMFPFGAALLLLYSAKPAAADTGHIRCQAGEGYVYLYQTLDSFQVLANLRCGQQVEILDPQNDDRVRIRTDDGKEGYIPRSGLTGGAIDTRQEAPAASSSVVSRQAASVPAPAASVRLPSAFGGYSGNEASGSEERDYSRIEIFGSYSLEIPAPSWGLPSNTRGTGIDASASINLRRWFAVEGEFGWNRATTNFTGITAIDRSMLFSGGPRYAYRQGRLSVFAHALFGANRLSASSSIPGIVILGVPFPGATVTDTSLAAVIGAGADIQISRHVALRNQADYLPTHHLSQIQNNHRFLFGFVVRL